MKTRRAHSWQLILADLSLILFLVTLTALAGEEAKEQSGAVPDEERPPMPDVAAAQALYRSEPLGPSISDWLSEQSPDPRATLTIFASHTGPDHEPIWQAAQGLAKEAEGQGFGVRVVITQGAVTDVYASLAYDAEALAE